MEMNTDKAILVVSFGTSYELSREKTIGAIERKIATVFPLYEVRRAFTCRTVINKLAEHNGLIFDSVEQALRRFINDGYRELIIQPTHVIKGFEYEKMMKSVNAFAGEFASLNVELPLLSSGDDFNEAASGIMDEVPQKTEDGTAVVFMGHSTEHAANTTYNRMLARQRGTHYS